MFYQNLIKKLSEINKKILKLYHIDKPKYFKGSLLKKFIMESLKGRFQS